MQASIESIKKLFEEPFSKLTKKAIKIHEESFPENDIELATLLSIKTGGCPEDCSYCSQSSKYETGSEVTKLMEKRGLKMVGRGIEGERPREFRYSMGYQFITNDKDRNIPSKQQYCANLQ